MFTVRTKKQHGALGHGEKTCQVVGYRQIVAQCDWALANIQKGLSNKRDGLPQKS